MTAFVDVFCNCLSGLFFAYELTSRNDSAFWRTILCSLFVLCVLTDYLAHSQNFSEIFSLFSIFLSQGEGVVTGMLSLQAKRMTTDQSNRRQLSGECQL